MEKSTRKTLWIVIAAMVLGVACITGLVLWGSFELQTRRDVERRIGATIRTPFLTLDGRHREVIAFFSIEPEGPAAMAGIHEGDIVIEDVSIADFCRRFQAPSGSRAAVVVVPGGDGVALAQREKREVSIVLP